jgi:hypothetical protein
MPVRGFLPAAVIGTLRQEKEERSTRKVQTRGAILAVPQTLEQRVAISCLIISPQPLLIQPVARKRFILSASVAAARKVER